MTVKIREETLVLGKVVEVEDIATVLGNLVDNAITAALGNEDLRLVEVTLMDEASELVIVVADSGYGIPEGADPFAPKAQAADGEQIPADQIHGRGIGLTLSQEIAQRRGGEIWVIERGGEPSGRGAVFGAKLPGVMEQTDSVNYVGVREEEN